MKRDYVTPINVAVFLPFCHSSLYLKTLHDLHMTQSRKQTKTKIQSIALVHTVQWNATHMKRSVNKTDI